jgi:hypothetical protein
MNHRKATKNYSVWRGVMNTKTTKIVPCGKKKGGKEHELLHMGRIYVKESNKKYLHVAQSNVQERNKKLIHTAWYNVQSLL